MCVFVCLFDYPDITSFLSLTINKFFSINIVIETKQNKKKKSTFSGYIYQVCCCFHYVNNPDDDDDDKQN